MPGALSSSVCVHCSGDAKDAGSSLIPVPQEVAICGKEDLQAQSPCVVAAEVSRESGKVHIHGSPKPASPGYGVDLENLYVSWGTQLFVTKQAQYRSVDPHSGLFGFRKSEGTSWQRWIWAVP